LQRFSRATNPLIVFLFMLSADANATTLAGWSQYGEHGTVEARLATDEPVCPALTADGKRLPMTERARPSEAFPVRVCVAAVPVGARHVSAAGLELPVAIAQPRHIVVFGDTGCRL
jgi:hypothetical protein